MAKTPEPHVFTWDDPRGLPRIAEVSGPRIVIGHPDDRLDRPVPRVDRSSSAAIARLTLLGNGDLEVVIGMDGVGSSYLVPAVAAREWLSWLDPGPTETYPQR